MLLKLFLLFLIAFPTAWAGAGGSGRGKGSGGGSGRAGGARGRGGSGGRANGKGKGKGGGRGGPAAAPQPPVPAAAQAPAQPGGQVPAVYNRYGHWCGTLNNPTEEETDLLFNHEQIVFISAGLEYGGEEMTEHLQIYFELNNRMRWVHVNAWFGGRVWLEPRYGSVQQAIEYTQKDGIFETRGVSSIDRRSHSGVLMWRQMMNAIVAKESWMDVIRDVALAPRISSRLNWAKMVWQTKRRPSWFLNLDRKGYRWQGLLARALLTIPTDNRLIIVVKGGEGREGKTCFIKWLHMNMHAMLCAPDVKSCANLWTGQRIVVFDIARAGRFPLWEIPEQLKSGLMVNTKYEVEVRCYEPPHIVITCNWIPEILLDSEYFTGDRIHIIDLDVLYSHFVDGDDTPLTVLDMFSVYRFPTLLSMFDHGDPLAGYPLIETPADAAAWAAHQAAMAQYHGDLELEEREDNLVLRPGLLGRLRDRYNAELGEQLADAQVAFEDFQYEAAMAYPLLFPLPPPILSPTQIYSPTSPAETSMVSVSPDFMSAFGGENDEVGVPQDEEAQLAMALELSRTVENDALTPMDSVFPDFISAFGGGNDEVGVNTAIPEDVPCLPGSSTGLLIPQTEEAQIATALELSRTMEFPENEEAQIAMALELSRTVENDVSEDGSQELHPRKRIRLVRAQAAQPCPPLIIAPAPPRTLAPTAPATPRPRPRPRRVAHSDSEEDVDQDLAHH